MAPIIRYKKMWCICVGLLLWSFLGIRFQSDLIKEIHRDDEERKIKLTTQVHSNGFLALNNTAPAVPKEDIRGVQRLREAMMNAGVDPSEMNDQVGDLSVLWRQLQDLFYPNHTTTSDGPVILGMERCEEFRQRAGPNATIALAGLFNTGTNAMFRNIYLNIAIPGNRKISYDRQFRQFSYINGIHNEVPWWKHSPWFDDESIGRKPDLHANILPIVMVRDPYFWRTSMCNARYNLRWNYSSLGSSAVGHQCPSFWYAENKNGSSMPVTTPIEFVMKEKFGNPFKVEYESLVDLWNQFYRKYLTCEFPRLIIRYEDALFYLPEILKAIKECAGGSLWQTERSDRKEGKFAVWKQHSKVHQHNGQRVQASDLFSSILKTADPMTRLANFSVAELEYNVKYLDPYLLQAFKYSLPVPT